VSDVSAIGVVPLIGPETAPFWEAAGRGELVIEQCTNCERFSFPPYGVCKYCRHREMRWTDVVGPGVIYSYTINNNQWTPDAPKTYGIAFVDFPAHPGVRMVGLLDGFEGEPAIDDLVGYRLDLGPGGLRRPIFIPWETK
jgi:uncharacterized OB-fold protein